jgi:hypothetical protein
MQLVINSPGTFITQKDECFRLKQKDKVFDISPLKVESIVQKVTNQLRFLKRLMHARPGKEELFFPVISTIE